MPACRPSTAACSSACATSRSPGQNEQNQSARNAQRLIVSEEEVIPATVRTSYGRMFGPSGGVDIRV